jgi:uroporphyrinogen decarboxylase
MTSRDRVKKVLRFEEVDKFPRDLWHLPGIGMFRSEELKRVQERFPNDIGRPDFSYGRGKRSRGESAEVGEYTDAYGCEWHVGERGVVGEVKGYPLADWKALDDYELPWEIIDQADFSRVDASCERSDRFILAGTEARPFERMQFLRGTENLYMDLAWGEAALFKLRDRLHEFYLVEIRKWCETAVDGISFMDDWGAQKSLLISPDMWRSVFKPLYKDYCDAIHGAGKYAFFHSDGNIEAIYPDLVEVGVDAVNSQLFCMDIEKLGEAYSGKIAFWGEIDRQHVLPFGERADVAAAVKRVAQALSKGKRTGLIAQCEWGVHDPAANIEAVFEEWDKY